MKYHYNDIIYHVVTNKLIKSKQIIKCIYNSRSNYYELRYIINNKIDWNMSIGEDNFSKWKLSCITFIIITIPLLIKIKIKLQIIDD